MRSIILVALVAAFPLVSAQAGEWQQCGGMSWTGATTCVSGSSCTKINDYYSQCIPGAPPATTTAGGSTPAPTSSTLPYVAGVNMAGYDFSVATDGSFTGTGIDPPTAQFSHFARQGVNIFRIPFAWQLMTPTVGGSISQSFFSRYDATVRTARSQSTNPWVILDLHNYARWNGQIIGQGGPTNAQYASIWSQLAGKYKNDQKIIFGIMNEPHDVPNLQAWADSVQAAVNAIRAAGATNYILIPGSSWSSAAALPTEAGPYLLKVTDPAGGKNKLIFDVHKYLDSDNSGTHPDCTTNNIGVFQTLYDWLKQNGRQALLSESGGGATSSSCATAFKEQLAFIKAHSDRIVGFTAWSAGSFDTSYVLTLTPNGDQDQPLWNNAIKPNLP